MVKTMNLMTLSRDFKVGVREEVFRNQNKLMLSIKRLLYDRQLIKFACSFSQQSPDEGICIPIAISERVTNG